VTVAAGPTRGALVAELAEVVGAPHEARFIVDEVLGLGLVLGQPNVPTGPLEEGAVAAARRMAARRAAGEPLQYVFGHWPFRDLDLLVDPRVLIPRPETEQVAEVAVAEARRLGRGSTGRGVVAVDASADALEVAAANVAAVRARRAGALPRVELLRGSWLQPLPASLRGAVDLVVSNPPYVSEEEWSVLAPEVRAEPRRALVAGPASDGTPGLGDVETVLEQAARWLGRPGTAVIELAPHQAAAAADLARRRGYDDVRVEPDLAGRPRALVARTARVAR